MEIINKVCNESEQMLNTFLPILVTYVKNISEVRISLGKEVVHILQSARELGSVGNSSQQLTNFCQAVVKLHEILTPEIVEQLRKVIK